MQDGTGKAISERLSPKDVKAGLVHDGSTVPTKAERAYLERFNSRAIQSEVSYEHLKGIRDHYKHKRNWSWLLMGAIAGMLIFQSVLLWQVGKGLLDFSQYEWLLPALLVQNLGQVVGLAVYAVRYLFSDITKQKISD